MSDREILRYKLDNKNSIYLQFLDSQLQDTIQTLKDCQADEDATYQLLSNSANCKFFLFKRKDGKIGFAKVQLDVMYQDLVDTDTTIVHIIRDSCRDEPSILKHFPRALGTYGGSPIVVEWSPTNHRDCSVSFDKLFTDDMSRNYLSASYVPTMLEMAYPTLFMEAIQQKPVCLFQIMRHIYSVANGNDVDLIKLLGILEPDQKVALDNITPVERVVLMNDIVDKVLAPKLYQMFYALVKLSSKTDFMHNDLHSGNILWDPEKQCFVVIDFGRSYIKATTYAKDIKEIVCRQMPYYLSLNKNDPRIANLPRDKLAIWHSQLHLKTCKGVDIPEFSNENWMLYYTQLRYNASRSMPFKMTTSLTQAPNVRSTVAIPTMCDVAAVSAHIYDVCLSMRNRLDGLFNVGPSLQTIFEYDGRSFYIPSSPTHIFNTLRNPPEELLENPMAACLAPGLMWLTILILAYKESGALSSYYYTESDTALSIDKEGIIGRLLYTTWVLLKPEYDKVATYLVPYSVKFAQNLKAYHDKLIATYPLFNDQMVVNKSNTNTPPVGTGGGRKSINKNKNKRGGGQVDSIDDIAKAYEEIFDISQKLRVPASDDNANLFASTFNVSRRPQAQNIRPQQLNAANNRPLVSAYGGKANAQRSLKVVFEGRERVVRRDGGKKYIIMNGHKVFLSSIRGKYRYI